jgi:hypothetical protein
MRMHAPQVVMAYFLGARRLERGHRTALRTERGEHAADGAVLAATVDRLQHHEHGVAAIDEHLVLHL